MISRREQPGDLQIGEAVLALTLSQRKGMPDSFPFTGGWVQRMSRRLGTPVGEHRALRIVRVLRKHGILADDGFYRQAYHPRQPSGWKVRLNRLVRVPRSCKASIRTRRERKPRAAKIPWWQHPLFGNPDGAPPPGRRR